MLELMGMSAPLEIRSDDPILQNLAFVPHRSSVVRCFRKFTPGPDEPQTTTVHTPWGEDLTAQPGDYLVCEKDRPDDLWPVNGEIFEATYEIIGDGECVKRALTDLVPLVALTNDPDRMVTIHALEGPETVRAGDFYLARGIKGEIWAYPRNKVGTVMIPVE